MDCPNLFHWYQIDSSPFPPKKEKNSGLQQWTRGGRGGVVVSVLGFRSEGRPTAIFDGGLSLLARFAKKSMI